MANGFCTIYITTQHYKAPNLPYLALQRKKKHLNYLILGVFGLGILKKAPNLGILGAFWVLFLSLCSNWLSSLADKKSFQLFWCKTYGNSTHHWHQSFKTSTQIRKFGCICPRPFNEKHPIYQVWVLFLVNVSVVDACCRLGWGAWNHYLDKLDFAALQI